MLVPNLFDREKRVGMLGKKNLVLVLASALLMAACGGGGGGNNNSSGVGGGDTVGGGGTPTDPGSGPSNPAVDQKLNGYLELGGNSLIYVPGDRRLMWGYAYNAVYLDFFENGRDFQGNEVFADIASGLSQEQMNDPAIQIRPEVAAPAAPIASFGFRVLHEVKRAAGVNQTGAQTVVGRVAFDFEERATTAGGRPERMTFIIDQIELGTNADGTLVTARALPDAKVYVTGTNAQGVTVNETISAPTNSVRLMPLSVVLDNYGDPTARVLQIDLEQAFSLAGNRLAAMHNMSGDFDMHVTLSSLKIVRPEKIRTDPNDPDPAWPEQDMVGKTIEMAGHTPVSGAGTSGRAWVRLPRTPATVAAPAPAQ